MNDETRSTRQDINQRLLDGLREMSSEVSRLTEAVKGIGERLDRTDRAMADRLNAQDEQILAVREEKGAVRTALAEHPLKCPYLSELDHLKFALNDLKVSLTADQSALATSRMWVTRVLWPLMLVIGGALSHFVFSHLDILAAAAAAGAKK